MNKIIVALIICICAIPAVSMAESDIYISEEHHYSFKVPEGWIEMPPEYIDMMNSEPGFLYKDEKVVTAYYTRETQVLEHPFILVKSMPLPQQSGLLEQLEEESSFEGIIDATDWFDETDIEGRVFESFSAYAEPQRRAVHYYFEVSKPVAEKARQTFFLNRETEEFTIIDYKASPDGYDIYASDFQDLIDSFEYEADYRPEPVAESAIQGGNNRLVRDSYTIFGVEVPRSLVRLMSVGIMTLSSYFIWQKGEREKDRQETK